jgi:hypothetical protein
MFQSLLFILLNCLTLTAVFAQANPISREDYSAAYKSAVEKSEKYSRQHKSRLVKYMNGDEHFVRSWDWEYEFPYKHRMIFDERTVERRSRLERVSLESKTFCKADNGNWVIETGACQAQLPWMLTQLSYMLRPNASSKLTSEQQSINGSKSWSYREYALFGSSSGANGKDNFSRYYDSIFWVDSTGRLTKQSFKSGALDAKQVFETWDDEIHYDGTIKVEEPNK